MVRILLQTAVEAKYLVQPAARPFVRSPRRTLTRRLKLDHPSPSSSLFSVIVARILFGRKKTILYDTINCTVPVYSIYPRRSPPGYHLPRRFRLPIVSSHSSTPVKGILPVTDPLSMSQPMSCCSRKHLKHRALRVPPLGCQFMPRPIDRGKLHVRLPCDMLGARFPPRYKSIASIDPDWYDASCARSSSFDQGEDACGCVGRRSSRSSLRCHFCK